VTLAQLAFEGSICFYRYKAELAEAFNGETGYAAELADTGRRRRIS
jgi:hypothetical protein